MYMLPVFMCSVSMSQGGYINQWPHELFHAIDQECMCREIEIVCVCVCVSLP